MCYPIEKKLAGLKVAPNQADPQNDFPVDPQSQLIRPVSNLLFYESSFFCNQHSEPLRCFAVEMKKVIKTPGHLSTMTSYNCRTGNKTYFL
jgi:hypothetical protein